MKTDKNVWITDVQLDELKDQAVLQYPEEACALLVGQLTDEGAIDITEVVLARNVAQNKRRFFEIDPSTRIKTEKRVRSQHEEVIGVFHSHPDGLNEPSEADIKMVVEKNLIWLVASVDKNNKVNIRAFLPREEAGFHEITLCLKA